MDNCEYCGGALIVESNPLGSGESRCLGCGEYEN